MATTRSSRSKPAVSAPLSSSPSNRHQTRAPFGFVFLFLLLVATFMFSTFFVISQTARERMVRQEASDNSNQVLMKVNALQSQVNLLSARVSALAGTAAPTTTSTTTTLPVAQPAGQR